MAWASAIRCILICPLRSSRRKAKLVEREMCPSGRRLSWAILDSTNMSGSSLLQHRQVNGQSRQELSNGQPVPV